MTKEEKELLYEVFEAALKESVSDQVTLLELRDKLLNYHESDGK